MFRAVAGAALSLLAGAANLVPARAADRDEALFVRPEDQRSVVFGSVDVGRSLFLTTGAKQTLVGPLHRTGFVVMEATGIGFTRERFGGEASLPALRFTTQSSVMIGHQWSMNGLFLAAFIGPELQHEQLTVAGRIYRFSQPQYGARAQFELWANPTADTLLTATVVAGSARTSLYGRASAGYRLFGGVYAGPEVGTYLTESYRETKVGAHVTGMKWGILEGRVSGGWTVTDDKRPGSPYLGLTAWMRL